MVYRCATSAVIRVNSTCHVVSRSEEDVVRFFEYIRKVEIITTSFYRIK